MAENTEPQGPERSEPVSVDTDIETDRTMITVSGTRDMAVIAYDETGERIYLPPEESDDGDVSPYRPAGSGGDSPYEGIQNETPYGASRNQEASIGVTPTESGFRIVQSEPVTDVRFIR